VARLLIVVGVVLIALTFLLAFTIYGEIAGVLGVLTLAAGVWMISRRPPRQAAGT